MALMAIGVLIGIAAVMLTVYIRWKYNYWKRKNMLCIPPKFPFGSVENPFSRTVSMGEWTQREYNKFKDLGVKHAGLYLFLQPIYFLISPDIIKNVMQTDFHHFVDRGTNFNEKDDPLSAHLFAIGGTKWRNLRTKLTPTFSSGKMKIMFSTLLECTRPMKKVMASICVKKEPIIIKDIVARFTTDVIGSCAFGLDCDSFKSEGAEFRYHGKKVYETTAFDGIKRGCFIARPGWVNKLGLSIYPKSSTTFYLNVVKDTIKYRKDNNVQRNDMLQILMDLQGSDKNESSSSLTIEEIAAQAFIFFLAGFETSSTTMTFCLYELAKNLEIQKKVRDEVIHVLNKYGEINYDAIMDMKYMNQVIDETLRKYPPLPFLTRQCVKEYVVPGTDVVIEKGTVVVIPVFGLQKDPTYFKDPENFDPERFSDENKKNIRPFTYLPFGEGPRFCVAIRFGFMQTKVGLATLLKDYMFTVNPKTENASWNKYSIIMNTEKPIWLNVEKVT